LKVVEQKPVAAIEDFTLILADVGEKALAQLRVAARDLLQGTLSENGAIAVAEELSSGRWTHDYPITHQAAAELGLNVSTKMPDDILSLLELFPDTVRRTPSVRYVEGKTPPAPASSPASGQPPNFGVRPVSFGPWASGPGRRPPGSSERS
jgi:ClpP class serine protease